MVCLTAWFASLTWILAAIIWHQFNILELADATVKAHFLPASGIHGMAIAKCQAKKDTICNEVRMKNGDANIVLGSECTVAKVNTSIIVHLPSSQYRLSLNLAGHQVP